MALIGVLYLLFEKSVLSPSEISSKSEPTLDRASKCIIGVQVGLIVLAMIVTKSSIASLQAKKGLPFGNQVVGWIVLSKS